MPFLAVERQFISVLASVSADDEQEEQSLRARGE